MSVENKGLIEISMRDLGYCKKPEIWTNHKAYGMWERNGEGEDGKVEVFLPDHREFWPDLYGAKFGYNPDGLPQTILELDKSKVKYIGKLD